MSFYKNQEFEFVVRTRKIIEHYNNFQIREEEKFDTTLFLNCLTGLLILPQQIWYDKLPDILISKVKWGIKETQIKFIKGKEQKDIRNIARHLRNSIAHYNFKMFKNTKNEIDNILFEDFQNNILTFKAIIPIVNLKIFVYKLSEMHLENMDKAK